MEFLKKHYEKIVLSVVLLVVAAAAFWLTQTVSQVQNSLDEQLQTRVRGNKKQLQPVDLTNAIIAVEEISKPVVLNLSDKHNVFNPVRWIRGENNTLKPDPQGDLASTLTLTNIRPLFLRIIYLGPTGLGDPFRYQFKIERQHVKSAKDRRPVTLSLTEGTKNEFFRLQEVHGPKDTSGEVVIELASGERITLPKDKPFEKVTGYEADLRFEKRDFKGKRADDTLILSRSTYKIVAIDKGELVVSAPNGTRTTIKLSTN